MPSSYQLPIDSVLPQLASALKQRHEVVLEAPPGAGKTTAVPLALLTAPWLAGQQILLLEPRRLAARAAAERMASLLGEKVAETVGYRVRQDSAVSDATRIEVITQGVLTRRLQDDPSLEGVGLVIFDEFHERGLDSDLNLALVLQGRALFRDDSPLRLLVMSATLDSQSLVELLDNAPLVTSEGRSFPVETVHIAKPSEPKPLVEQLYPVVQRALWEQSGNLLVFLPGSGEIRRLASLLAKLDEVAQGKLLVCPLFGDLSLAEQRQAIAAPAAGQRKVVLATNIAESSLTIEGIRVVIDSGYYRHSVFDANTGLDRLHTSRISRASATQRAGRAGRLEPGVCYRLWSADQQHSLARYSTPEIHSADLASLLLQLKLWGSDDPAELDWLDAPTASSLAQAEQLLESLGALSQGQLSERGEFLARLPMHPRLANLCFTAQQMGNLELGCELAALLEERDPLGQTSAEIAQRLEWLRGERHCERSQQAQRQRIRQQAKRYRQLCSTLPTATAATLDFQQQLAVFIASAWPDRIAQRRETGETYRLASGRAAALTSSDPLARHNWLAIAQCSGDNTRRTDQIRLATELDEILFEGPLSHLLEQHHLCDWDEQQQRVRHQIELRLGKLSVAKRSVGELSAEQNSEIIIGQIRRQGLAMLAFNDAAQRLCQRISLVHKNHPDSAQNPWPDTSEQGLLGSLETWLAPYLDGVNSLAKLQKIDLLSCLRDTLLPWPLVQQLDELAPERLTVPSGNRIAIDYSQSPPVLAVKLQEMFGCTSTPSIGYNSQLQIHLLSPAGRPLQVTQDLAHFWANSYQLVKKEMKGRYPKHPWPDDPLTFTATAKTKRHLG